MVRPDRRVPSPAAQRRRDERWRARVGLTVAILLLVLAVVLAVRLSGARRPAETPPRLSSQQLS
jgi:hypothetical protein